MRAEVIAQDCTSIHVINLAVTQQVNLVIWQILLKLKNLFPMHQSSQLQIKQ